ncbi:phage tail tip lysozyme [Alicyclobacillus vulcanalis]|uniref:phage tail tip lysozyme n=1 Tax=Alicyclobacillus vulcanalis TaxID=252246 RepID=UPI0013564916|nr:phage tail tip lysozyme [Alicyclobacillus vulcanalis]
MADDQASKELKAIAASLDTLKKALASLNDFNPFADLEDTAAALSDAVRALSDDFDALKAVMDGIVESSKGIQDLAKDLATAQKEGQGLRDTLQGVKDAADGVGNPFREWQTGAESTDSELNDVKESVESIRDTASKDPFAGWSGALAGVQTELAAIADELRAITDMAKSSVLADFTKSVTAASTASKKRSSEVVNLPNLTPEEAEKWFLGLQEDKLPSALKEDYQAAMEAYMGWGKTSPEERDLQAPQAFYEQFQKFAQWQAAQQQAQSAPAEEKAQPEELPTPAWAKGATEINSMLSELPMRALTYGMNAMMGYYGIQSIANSTNNLQAIQEMMQLNNQTVNEAAQSYAMLASMGMTGTSGVQFLQNLMGNLQKEFTPEVGSGALSQQAIILQSLGITRQALTTSPWELLNTIGVRYRQLLAQGRGQQASELLNLTDTSQLAPMLANWNTLQKQTSGINLNMTPQQLNSAVQQNLTLQASLQKLSLAFTQLAVALAPLVEKITKALTDVANAITQSKNPFQAMGNIVNAVVKDLGALPAAILGAIAALKAASFAADVMSGAGLIGEVGKGMSVGKLVGKSGRGIFNLLSRGGEKGAVALGGEAAATGAEAAVAGAAQSVSLLSRLSSVLSSLAAPLTRLGGLFSSLMDGLAAVAAPLADVAEVVGGALLAAFSAIDAPILAVVAAMAAVGVGIYELVTHWKQIGPAMDKAWGAVKGWVDKAYETLSKWADNAKSTLQTWADNAWERIRTWANDTKGTLQTWSEETWQKFMTWKDNLVGWAGGLWDDVKKDFDTWSSNLHTWASGLWGKVSKDWDNFRSNLATWVDNLWGKVKSDWDGFQQSLGGWVSNLWNNVVNDWNSFQTSLGNFVSGLWNNTVKDWNAFTSSVGKWASALWNGAKGGFDSFVSNLQTWAGGLWGAVSGAFQDIKQGFQQWVSDLGATWQAVKNFFTGGGPSTPLPNLKGNSTAQEIWNYLRSQGLTPSAAAGVMGNLMQESSLNPTAVNSSSGAFGIAQWLGPRYTELVQYASKNHTSASNLAAQLGFLWSEIQSGQYVNISKLNSMNPAQAAVYFEENYEKAGSGAALANRENYAEAIYRAFASSTGTHLIYGPFTTSELPSSEKTTSKKSTTSEETKKVSEAASTAQKSLDTYAKTVQTTGTTSTTAAKYVTQASSQSETTVKNWSTNQVTQFKTWSTNTEKEIGTWATQVEKTLSSALNVLLGTFEKWSSSVEKALEGWSAQTENIFSQWVQHVQSEIAQLVAQAQAAAYAAAAASAASASSASGSVKKGTSVPKLASGGLVTSPTLALIGEAGPEMVLPLNEYPVNPGAIGRLGAGGAGGSGALTINVNVNGPQLTDSSTARKLAQVVANELVQNLKRRGNFDWT